MASAKKALEHATIAERGDAKISGEQSVRTLLAYIKALLKESKEARELAAEAGDPATEDLFIGYIGGYEKLVRMLEAYLG